MNTKQILSPLENRKRGLENERDVFLKKITEEINAVETSIRETVKELSGISDNDHTWIVGDVFICTFWSKPEMCIIQKIEAGYITFIRLESIRCRKTLAKDYCAAQMEVELFLRIGKTFAHHSEWYYEYQNN